jgi:hypothetical protein
VVFESEQSPRQASSVENSLLLAQLWKEISARAVEVGPFPDVEKGEVFVDSRRDGEFSALEK